MTVDPTAGALRPLSRPDLAWTGDWRARIADRLRQIGQEDPAAFFVAHSGVSYAELARLVGPTGDVAAVQLECLHAETAPAESGARQEVMLDSLTRFLRGALKHGWGSGHYWQTDVITALGAWTVAWGGTGDLRRVKAALFAKQPPAGWTPLPANDPLLRELMSQALSDG